MKPPKFKFDLDQRVRIPGWSADAPPPARVTGRRFEDRLAADGTIETEIFYQVEVKNADGLGRSRLTEAALVSDPDPGPWPPEVAWFDHVPAD